jgi:protein phosphatase
LAVSTLQKYFSQHWTDQLPDASMITEAIMLANQTLFDINQINASAGSGRMGTTLIMALVQDTKIAIAHVGDSRIYRVTRRGGLEQLTVDHEVGQQAIQNGLDPDIAYSRPDAYQLTQALGPHGSNFIQPDVRFLDIQEDTLLLLCSDGISDNNLVEENWEHKLLPLISSSQSIDRGMNKLLEFANDNNGHDNLTGVLVRLKVRPQIQVNDW